jgi:transcriptional regulator with XRE-family HTH domain
VKNRIKQVRKSKNLTQTAFGEIIGVKGNTITNYENGLRIPTDAVVKSICREFDVNEEWLRNGTGEMFIPKSKIDEIAEMLADVQVQGNGSFKFKLISALARLDDSGWDSLEKLIDSIVESK